MLIKPQKRRERFQLDIYRRSLVYGIITDPGAGAIEDVVDMFQDIYDGYQDLELEQDDFIIVLEPEDQAAVIDYLQRIANGEVIDFSDVLSFIGADSCKQFADDGSEYDG